MKKISLIGLLAVLTAFAGFVPDAVAQPNPAALRTPGAPSTAAAGKAAGSTRAPSPPALPGARAEPTQVAPANKNVADMPPTEALFDAVNRGDLPSVKDAMSRGAELNGKNVLGLSPTELAVDLGRNEISFYLLSLRGGIAGSSPTGPGPAPKPPTRAERMAADREARAERAARARPVAVEGPPAAAQTARLFQGNGGSPVPQAGFLGFGSGR